MNFGLTWQFKTLNIVQRWNQLQSETLEYFHCKWFLDRIDDNIGKHLKAFEKEQL